MNKTSLLLFFGLFFILEELAAQTTDEQTAAKLPIQQLFEGMRKSDSTVVRTSLLAGAHLEAIVKNANGETTVKSELLWRIS